MRGTTLRWVLDTNVVVSGLLWGGHSRRLLELALDNAIALYSSPVLIDELSQTLHYAKLAKRITALQTTALALVAHYSAMVTLVVPQRVPRVRQNAMRCVSRAWCRIRNTVMPASWAR
ncbi:MAG: hypothetical protein RJA63_1619 [Pseudomonadota bacterium]|jgi:putative PIN family toxin of toxin-antitoxin system